MAEKWSSMNNIEQMTRELVLVLYYSIQLVTASHDHDNQTSEPLGIGHTVVVGHQVPISKRALQLGLV